MSIYSRKEGVIVPPKSIADIASITKSLREFLGLSKEKYLPIVQIYEILKLIFDDKKAKYEVWEDHLLKSDEARSFPDKLEIYLRESVYDAACRGDGRSRFTMSHELAHLALHRGVSFNRSSSPHKIYENSEWQADIFASHFLMPTELLNGCNEIESIMNDFGASCAAAEIAIKRIKRLAM